VIYLDNAATTWPKPEEVYLAVDTCLRGIGGNPGRGGHGNARMAGHILYQAREALAQLLNIKQPTNIIFTYNATDALNTAILGSLKAVDHIVTTSMEHNAIARPLRSLEKCGTNLTVVVSDKQGRTDLSAVEQALKTGAKAVVMSHASNVTGTIMSIAEVGAMAVQYGSLFIVDAAQTAGVEMIDVEQMNIDMLAFSGHKGLFGPQGTGGLYVRPGVEISPLRYGGTGSLSELDIQPEFLPDRLESGTPNTPGIAGLLAGVKFILKTGQENIRVKELELAKKLIDGLNNIPEVEVYGPISTNDRTAVVSFNIEGMDGGEVAHLLDSEFEIACRAGLHCAPWAHRTIGTINTGTVRFSPGYFNSKEDVDNALAAVNALGRRRRFK